MQIKYSDWGIACRVKDIIYLNKKLKQYPKLHNALLQHEQEHSSGFTWKDIKIDLDNHYLKNLKLKYWQFVLSTPKSWVELIPIYFKDGNMLLNPLILLMWGNTILIVGIIGWILGI